MTCSGATEPGFGPAAKDLPDVSMDDALLNARRPSSAIARTIARSRQSVGRCLQNRILSELTLSGRVLDVGGGRKAAYNRLIRSEIPIETLNINPNQEPTHLVSAEVPFPFDHESFDAVISVDTMEHVYDDQRMIREIIRVVKVGGVVHIIVPFFYPVHGSPRATRSG